MDKHIALARELGYEGLELRDFLKSSKILKGRKGLPKGIMIKRKGMLSRKIRKGRLHKG